jgi:hypothetical protein
MRNEKRLDNDTDFRMLVCINELEGGKMKKIFTFILFVSIAIFIANCGGEEEIDSYFPLSVGNVWEYMVGMTVAIPGTTYIFMGNSQDNIIGTTQLVGGASVFQLATSLTLDGYSGRDTFYIHETDTAVYLYESPDDTIPDKYLELPIETGNTWTVNSYETAVVLGTSDVSVPAGDYQDCWEIAFVDESDTTFVYLALGVGEVKGLAGYSVEDTTVTIRLDLESATIQ